MLSIGVAFGYEVEVDESSFFNDLSSLSNGLVAHYEFEGDAKDSSGNGNDGTEHGGVTYVDGIIGKAAKFDGVDDYVDVSHNDSLTLQQFTISAWVNISNGTNYEAILLKGRYNGDWENNNQREYELKLNYSSYFGTDKKWHSIYYTSNTAYNSWQFLTFSYDGQYLKIYRNGKLDNMLLSTVEPYNPLNAESLTIGSVFDVNNRYIGNRQQALKGLIDDLRIYNRALSEDEIKALYELGQ